MGNSNVKIVAIGLVSVVLIAVGLVLFKPREAKIVGQDSNLPSITDSEDRDFTEGGRAPRIIDNSGSSRNGTSGSGDAATDSGESSESADGETAGADGEVASEGSTVILGPDGKPLPGQVLTAGGALANGGGTSSSTNRSGSLDASSQSDGSSDSSSSGEDGEGSDEDENDEPEDGEVQVLGYVMRGDRGVDGAVLNLTSSSGGGTRTANTDAEGYYQFPPVANGEHYLVLVEPASPNSRRTLFLSSENSHRQEDFVIPELPPIQGDVYDAETQEGIQGVVVEVLQGATMIGARTTDEYGHFELFPLDPGNYTVRAKSDIYETDEETVTVTASNPNSEVLEFYLTRSKNIAGVVLSPQMSPLSGAYVSLFSGAAYGDATAEIRSTGGDGRFEFPELSPTLAANYRVGAYYEGYVPAYSQPIGGENVEDIQVMLTQGGTLTGTVVDDEGTPVEYAELTVQQGFQQTGAIFQRVNVSFPSTTTDLEGRFSLPGIEPGSVSLAVAAEGFVSNTVEFSVSDGTQDVGEIVLEGDGEAKAGRIFGIVVDETGGALANHNIYVKEAGGSWDTTVKTDSRGGFKVDDVPDGEYIIYSNGSTLRGDVFMTMDQTYPFARPGDEQIYLVYDMSQTARIRVVDSAGEPITRFRVGVNNRYDGAGGNGGVRETIGNAYSNRLFETVNGEAILNFMIAGTSNITITVENVGTEEVNNARIPVGGEADLGDVVIDTGVSVSGRVVSSGSGVDGVLVQAIPPYGSPLTHPLNAMKLEARTQSDGTFSIGGMPGGAADFLFTKSGMTRERLANIQLSAGQPHDLGTVEIHGAAILTGTVRSVTGQALPEMMVTIGEQTLFTDLQGQYRADTVMPGLARITVTDRANRYQSSSQEIELIAGQPQVLDFALAPI